MDKKPIVIEIVGAVFNGTVADERAKGSVKSSGDLIITAEAETLDAISQFLACVADEEEKREVA